MSTTPIKATAHFYGGPLDGYVDFGNLPTTFHCEASNGNRHVYELRMSPLFGFSYVYVGVHVCQGR